ncbi:MAG TPA: N-acetylmuramic acid 6-phosphate etherase [Candidatus Angelobacter sp.]|nr:N-acetylmuramic acid 6-phosphate etherase [Candidatus Angelobacter sp.]
MLKTESTNPASTDLDTMSALEIAEVMNQQDAIVPRAIKRVLPEVARAIDMIVQQLAEGGRLIYVGTGTSGRIGALDAAEVPPTFGTRPGMIQFVMAGGEGALAHASEASEDNAGLGRRDMAARKPDKKDVVVGIAASGRTPYTVGAIEFASSKGATTVAVVCNKGSDLAHAADCAIEVDVGPEVLTGSTRLKAGTAQKLICNMLSTGAMARLGYVYGNRMVNLQLRNHKLTHRGISIIEEVGRVDREVALRTLKSAGMKVPVALIMLAANVSKAEAIRRLRRNGGVVRKALRAER